MRPFSRRRCELARHAAFDVIGVHLKRTLFEGVDLAIGVKDRIGLVGRNGAANPAQNHRRTAAAI